MKVVQIGELYFFPLFYRGVGWLGPTRPLSSFVPQVSSSMHGWTCALGAIEREARSKSLTTALNSVTRNRPIRVEPPSNLTGRGAAAASEVGVPISRTMTVVMPVYNESATIDATARTVIEFAKTRPDLRFLFVDDGSFDHTPDLLRAAGVAPLALQHAGFSGMPRVSMLTSDENIGKGNAIAMGMSHAQGQFVCFMDGDLAYSLEHLDALIDRLAGFDVVIGSRRETPAERLYTPKLRRLMGWGFNKTVRLALGLTFRDTQAGLKAMRRGAAQRVFSKLRMRGFGFDIELLYVAKLLKLSVGEIPAKVARSHRKKPSSVNLLTQPAVMFRDVCRVRLNGLLGRYAEGK